MQFQDKLSFQHVLLLLCVPLRTLWWNDYDVNGEQ